MLFGWLTWNCAHAAPDTLQTATKAADLSEIITGIEVTNTLRNTVQNHLKKAQQTQLTPPALESIQQALDHPWRDTVDESPSQTSLIYLFNLERQFIDHDQQVEAAYAALRGGIRVLEADFSQLNETLQRWEQWRITAQERRAPAVFLSQVDDLVAGLRGVQAEVQSLRDARLLQLYQLMNLRSRLELSLTAIDQRRAVLDRQLRTAAGVVIWRTPLSWADLGRLASVAKGHLQAQMSAPQPYWQQHGLLLTGLMLSAGMSSFIALGWARRHRPQQPATTRSTWDHSDIGVTLDHPVTASLLLALVIMGLLAPNPPLVLMELLNLSLPFVVLPFAYHLRGQHLKPSLVGIVAAFILTFFWSLLEPLPIMERAALLIQVLWLGAGLFHDYRRGHWFRAFPEVPRGVVHTLILFCLGSLALGLLAIVVGTIGMARMFTYVPIAILTELLVFGSTASIIYTLTAAFLQSPLASHSRLVTNHRAVLLQWLRRGLIAVIALHLLQTLLSGYGVAEPASRLLKDLLDWRAPINRQAVSLGQGLMATGILVLTWLAMKLIGILFEEEILPRQFSSTGFFLALSVISRYLIGVMGFMIATQTLGFDLTQVTLLAGALGVGIGFGLQNIFSNFASGLILLVERPINVGDVIESGKLQGIVRRIGIRSSTLRTLQGAEVILPNAELIANPIINWTLSDHLRRMEIELAIEDRGRGVEVIIPILETAASDSHDVLPTPPPYALFTGSDGGKLTFRLCAWIERYEDEARIASGLRRTILSRLASAGL